MTARRRASTPVGARHLVAHVSVPNSPPLLLTKLAPPTLRPGTVERSRILDLLQPDPKRRIVSVIAPPGYGKTTLLAQLAGKATCARRPVAWLTLDDLDNDPAMLLAYLAAAFDPLLPLAASHRGPLSGLVTPVVDRAVARFASRLESLEKPALLVLDNVDRLVDQTCLDVVSGLIDHLPPGVCVALAGRAEPDLPFARFRAQGNLLEIRQDVLALDEGETTAMAAAAGCELEPRELRRLVDRTEGWPAAIYLATLAALDEPSARSRLVDVSGADPYIADYLRSEFARRITVEDMAVLTRTSILESIPCALADALAGPGAGERLWTLARDQRLISRRGRVGRAVRYHPLLRDFLLAELEHREPGATKTLHGAAATWHRSIGQHQRAVDHAIKSGDGRIVAAAVTAGARDAAPVTVDRWLLAIDDSTYRQYPPVAVVAAWRHLLSGRAEEAERLADIAEQATFVDRPTDGSASFVSQVARLRAVMGRHGAHAVFADAVLATSSETARSPWYGAALWLLGEAYLLLGDTAAGDAALRDAASAPSRDRLCATIALAGRACLRIDEGDWGTADALMGESRREAVAWSGEAPVAFLRVYAVDARVAILLGDVQRARDDLVRAQAIAPLTSHASPWLSVDGLLQLAQAYLSLSEIRNAQEALRRAEQIVRRRPNLGTLGAKLIFLRGQIAAAASTLVGSSVLTPAELRVVPYLPTHLSFQDIADRLTISRNTVKTHAMSIYSKLWASSRDEAVRRAVELGLLAPNPVLEAEQHGAHAVLLQLDDGFAQVHQRSGPLVGRH
ncbi:MAG TPA: LuxR C-terminal-related transcriptional regulator [Candidatus Limnocylindrales bacterium]|nr:LuxR C-terminal-related transcriptional regulator [Candidatus Limnocylindrales bacterium]